MKIKLYFYCVLIIAILYPASARARTVGRDLKKLINDSDIVACVTATKVLQQDDKVSCELLADKFFKRHDSVDNNLAITMPRPRPGQRPRPDSIVQGQRYLVFLKSEGPAFQLSDEILGVIHLRGEKKMRNYVLDGSPAKLKRLNEPELLARVQELTADIAPVPQIQQTEKPQPLPKKIQKTQKADDNAAPYYEKAISLYVEMPERLAESLGLATSPQDLTNKNMASLTQWLHANEKALAQVHLGAQKSYCKFTDTGDKLAAVMSRQNKIKGAQQAMCMRAKLNAENGNISKAIDDITDCFSIGGHFVAGPTFIIEKMVAIAFQASALHTAFTIIDTQNLDTDVLAKIQNTFEDLAAKYGSSFNLEGEKDYTQQQIMNDPASKQHEISLEGVFEYFDLVAKKTPWQLKNDKKLMERKPKNALLQTTGIEKIVELYNRSKIKTKALITTIAALRYRTDKGKFPQNLNEIIRAGYLKALPMDPYSDKSLVYKPAGSSFILYSVGADFDDDDGKHDKKWGADGGDYVFWPVKRPKKTN